VPPLSAESLDDLTREVRRLGREGPGVAVAVGAAILVAVVVLVGALGGGGPAIVLIPVLGVVAILAARAAMTASTYEVVADPAPVLPAIGETFAWGVRVVARREFVLLPATVTLRCQEHAIRRAGNNTSHYRRTIYEHRYSLAGRSLGPGETYDLRPRIAIPPYAIPSRDDGNHRIEWLVELRAPTGGFIAGIRRKTPVRVVAKVTEGGHPDDAHVPAAWLASAPIINGRSGAITPGGIVGQTGEKLKGITVVGEGFMAALEIPEGLVSDHGPVLPAGTTREMRLVVEGQEAIRCRALRVWIGCRIAGRGSPEHIALFHEESVYEGDLVPGQPVHAPIRVTIPPGGPVTYIGEHVRFEWLVRVRVDVPFWRDRMVEIPFVVTPQAVQPGG
jgi:hypothetical protein